jgi:citronellyl-CoA synthetase
LIRCDLETGALIRNSEGRCERVGEGERGLFVAPINSVTRFDGYADESATQEKILRDVFSDRDRYFNSGDLMTLHDDGWIGFADRVGDTFRWKGENVSTTEVEAVVNSFDQVSQSSVYGVAIPGTDGRAGMASIIVEKEVAEFDFDGLLDVVRKGLPPYAIPLFIRLRTEFETTETLKIRKSECKKEGCDPAKVTDPLYVLLPGNSSYAPMTHALYEEIVDGKHRF